ncbi:MAG: 3'-5' exonuclease [Gemmatimonadota bacterium]
MIGLGLRFRPRLELRDRAARILGVGPLAPEDLALRLFDLRQVPGPLADRLVWEVLKDDPEFRRDGGGLWRYGPAGAWPSGVRLDELTYCVVDVETTGGAPWHGHRLMEFGAVKISGRRVVGRFCALVNPGRAIPPFVRRLTGITETMVARAPRFAEVAGALREFLAGSVFVAHNAAFDWKFIEAESERASGLAMEGTRLCTLRLARRLYPELVRGSLDALAERFAVPLETRHRAGDDAEATAFLFLRFLDRLAELGVTDWASFVSFLTQRRDGRPEGGAPRASGQSA